MTVNAYEVELRLTNPNTKAVTAVTRTEHAYSPFDAFQQALLNQCAQQETGSAEIKVLHIGPPRAAIEAATLDLARQIQERVLGVLAAAAVDRKAAR
jgi:hypothetical protein